jgi:triphosphoribosyl-dephospho-CoA synthase
MLPHGSEFVIESATAMPSYLHAEKQRHLYSCTERLAWHAARALIEEVELTPKPGLVDRRGAGSHHDLSFDLFIKSARALEPFFQKMAEEARRERVHVTLRTTLGKLGREAESEMLRATNGINTHRGAIWSLGLLIAGAAIQQSSDAATICRAAGRLARLPDTFHCIQMFPVPQQRRTDANFGARREASEEFPHVFSIGLPTLQRARAMGVPENFARVDALLAIMSTLPDTCILQRGGPSALRAVQRQAKRVVGLGGASTFSGAIALQALEQTMLQLWVSPGGSADLLAATLFLDRLISAWIPTRD